MIMDCGKPIITRARALCPAATRPAHPYCRALPGHDHMWGLGSEQVG